MNDGSDTAKKILEEIQDEITSKFTRKELTLFGIGCLLTGFLFGYGISEYQASEKPPISIESHTPNEAAALYILKLGFLEWVGNCFYAAGETKMPIEQAKESCLPDLNLPPLNKEP